MILRHVCAVAWWHSSMITRVGGRQRHRLRAHGAHPQRLHGGELHPLHRSRLESGLDDAVPDIAGIQLGAGLGDDLQPMRQHQDRAIALRVVLDDLTGDDGLAAPVGATSRMRRLPAATSRSTSAITST